MEVWIAIGLAVLVIAGVAASMAFEKRRREAIRQAAAELGMEYRKELVEPPGPGLGTLPLFNRGRSRRVRNVLSGQIEDIQVHLFDYTYRTGSGKNSQTHRHSIAALGPRDLDVAKFELRPEHFFHRLGAIFGYQDIDLDHAPDFSKRYLLRAPDEAAARELFNEEVTDYFAGRDDVCVEGDGGWVIIYPRRKRVKPAELGDFLSTAFDVVTRIANRQFALSRALPSGHTTEQGDVRDGRIRTTS